MQAAVAVIEKTEVIPEIGSEIRSVKEVFAFKVCGKTSRN
jgi:hypothetical protein